MFITVGVRRLFALFGLLLGLFKFTFRLVLGRFSLGFVLRYAFFNSSFMSFPGLLYVFINLLCPFPDLLYTFSVFWVQVIREHKLSRTRASVPRPPAPNLVLVYNAFKPMLPMDDWSTETPSYLVNSWKFVFK